VIAHIAGLPVEETLAAASGASTMLLVAGGWIRWRLGRRR
jgi:hypothetical protein